MTPRYSLYLDLVRALAAFVVIIDHAPPLFDMPSAPRLGHQAVMVFFVLSGLVISHVAESRETTARVFLVSRFARLWSVLVPALALTIVCDLAGRTFGTVPDAYAAVHHDFPLIRAGAILLFLSESWVSIDPFSNGVVWSLCAEFWYYILFAAWVFVPAGRWRAGAVTGAMVLAGPKAVLLLPVWLMGVALQRSQRLFALPVPVAAILFVAGLGLAAWVMTTTSYNGPIGFMQHNVSPWVVDHLGQARVFWYDWLFGLVVTAHLCGGRRIAEYLPLEAARGAIRWCAGISFAAYLFHAPLLQFFSAFLPRTGGWIAVGLTVVAIALLGPPVEQSKRWWRRMLERAADRIFPIQPADRAAPGPRGS